MLFESRSDQSSQRDYFDCQHFGFVNPSREWQTICQGEWVLMQEEVQAARRGSHGSCYPSHGGRDRMACYVAFPQNMATGSRVYVTPEALLFSTVIQILSTPQERLWHRHQKAK